MEKKKTKVWKIILIILIILLVILAMIITRKVFILSELDKKVSDYENNYNNIYIKTIYDYTDYTSESERFIKDDIDKLVTKRTDLEGNTKEMIQFIYPNERKLFTQSGNNKVLTVFEEKAPTRGSHIENNSSSSYSVIRNFAYSMNLSEKILNSFVTKIKSVKVDGKECYELSSSNNSNFLYSQNVSEIIVYVEKNSGLPVKAIEIINENGIKSENITNFEFEFNTVTDEDIKEPNNSEYELK